MLGNNTLDRRFLVRKHKESKLLIISDLHLGLEIEWSEEESRKNEPKWSYETIKRLKKDIKVIKPDILVILGDLDHNISYYSDVKNGIKIQNYNIKERALEFFQKHIISIPSLEIILARGEQDSHNIDKLSDIISVFPENGVSLAGNSLGVFHGHENPNNKVIFSSEVILGHLHPAIELTDEFNALHELPVFSRLIISREEVFKIFNYNLELEDIGLIEDVPITILPAYNQFLKGFILNKKRKDSFNKAINIDKWLINIIHHPKLEIRLTNGIDLGYLVDL